jgi:hypothetical protein
MIPGDSMVAVVERLKVVAWFLVIKWFLMVECFLVLEFAAYTVHGMISDGICLLELQRMLVVEWLRVL